MFDLWARCMFVIEFATQQIMVVSKNAVILAEFKDCMRPDKVHFDRLHPWARVLNLPYTGMTHGEGR